MSSSLMLLFVRLSMRETLFDWDADLVRTASQHRLRILFLDQDPQCPLCGQVLDRFCDHAAVCPWSQTVFHIGPAMTDLLESGFLLGKT